MNNQVGHWYFKEQENHWYITQYGTDLFIFIPKLNDELNNKHYAKTLAALVNQANTAHSKSDACTRAYVKALERKIWRQNFCMRKWREEANKTPRKPTLGGFNVDEFMKWLCS